MSVDSKCFVVAEINKALEVGRAVEKAINTWQRGLLDNEVEKSGAIDRIDFLLNKGGKENWTNGCSVTGDFNGTFTVAFKVNGEHRILWYNTDCSCDTDDITTDHTLMFSIGKWGLNKEIMIVVIEAIKPFGVVYYVDDDCADEIKIEFLYSQSKSETYKVVMWSGEVRTEYELKIELDFVSEVDYGLGTKK